jgi:alpha-L-fucosidase 2
VNPHGTSTRIDCGNLAMPERAFTVSAWVYPRSARGQQAIFSAMTSDKWQHWPVAGPAQISYGFTLSTIHGKLSAMLNRVRITASEPLPLNRWSRVAAIYNGRSLSVIVNGVSVATTEKFPTAMQVVGPQWDWNAIHPGDQHIVFDGCSPRGLLAVRVLGVVGHISHGSITLTLQAGRNATVLLSAMDDRDATNDRAASLKLLHSLRASGVEYRWNQHLVWWKKFWQHSYISITDKKIQDAWYGSLYVLACCSEPGNIAPGLWGNFITTPNMGWNGDYTLDYNYEAPYWAAYPTNHVALAKNYDQALLDWMQRGAALARHRHYHGLFYYAHLSPMPGWSADGAKAIRQKSDALFACVDCLQRWRYTRNVAYARKVYPLLRGVAQFWDHYLVLKNGVYMDYNDAADELQYPRDVNPATSIAFLQMLYSGLLDINHTLQLNDPDATKWRHILTHLSPLPIVPASSIKPIVNAVGRAATQGKFVIRNALIGSEWINFGRLLSPNPPIRVTGSSAGMNSHQAIFPGWAVGLESPRLQRQAAFNTIRFQKTWYDANNTSSFYPAAADAGYNPQSILRHLHLLVTHIAFPNFAYNIGNGGVENQATVPTTICAMFLQSYQKHIHLFPNWPKNQNATFGNLLACGDFLVSSSIELGKIAYVRIISKRGGVCSLANPWPDHKADVTITGKPSTVVSGSVLKLHTTPGEALMLTVVK